MLQVQCSVSGPSCIGWLVKRTELPGPSAPCTRVVVRRRGAWSSRGRRKETPVSWPSIPALAAASRASETKAVAGKSGKLPTTCCWHTSQAGCVPWQRAPAEPTTIVQPCTRSLMLRCSPRSDGTCTASISARSGSSGANCVVFSRKEAQSQSSTTGGSFSFRAGLSRTLPRHSRPTATGTKRSPGRGEMLRSLAMPTSPQPPQ
mmetsp:Transcript_11661/g.34561  ORF Transcript_11661/g.34561 Transcript_11661/m.34561 type:complete len:204 (+) Transcript_11661:2384-2995(+)